MGYPPQGQYGPQPGQQPGQGYPQQGPPPGYQQGYAPQQNYQQGPPQGGYAPFQQGQGYGGAASGGYDWQALYGMADHTVGQLIDAGQYTAIVKDSGWDRTKDGTKGAWTIVFILTSGPRIGMKLTMTMTVSPKKNNGEDNEQGMGILFRQLGAMGIPVPPQQQPWWMQGWSEVNVAQAMIGKPVLLQVIQDEYEGVTRNKVRDVLPPPPGAPTQLPQQAQQQPQGYGPQPGFQQGPPQPGAAPAPWQQPQQAPPPQQGPPQGQQPWQQPGPPQGYPQQGPPQQQWQPQQGYAGQQGPPPGYDPTVPGYAQPAQPGQPGMGQFTQQGQAVQPGTNPQQTQGPPQGQPPWGNGYPQQPQQQGPPPQSDQGPPQAPSWGQ